MDIQEILNHVDHTNLKQDATYADMKTVLDDAMKYETASACIPPCFVGWAKKYVGNRLKICTVIGFPNGYSTMNAKVFETKDAVKNGASEIDMVININELKSGNVEYVLNEIKQVKRACKGRTLKVIVETCLLSEEEKITMCRLVTEAKADYIKTSTGFAGGGATKEDITLFKQHVGKKVKIKAAGGIKSIVDAEALLELGADRIGTSKIVAEVKSRE